MTRKRTPEEMEQKRLTLEERRLKMASDLMDEAETLRRQLSEPFKSGHWGVETRWDPTTRTSLSVPAYRERTLKQPPPREKKEIMIALGIAVDKSQLLSGQATERTEQLTPEQAKERIVAIYTRANLRHGLSEHPSIPELLTMAAVGGPTRAIRAPREVIEVP
jgi:hypothetical protein